MIADERTTLDAFLDSYREVIKKKARGISEDDARRRLVPSATTIGGIVKHLRWVEMGWFQRVLAQTPSDELPPLPYTDDDPDGDFRMEPGETLDGLIADYDQECERSRNRAAGYALDHVVPHRRHGQVSLRWIVVHMIEETARHAGHVDILREQIDGSTGFDG
ncbi:MAG: DUF664 domain-containing protein [Pseudonocardiaceae bacterium]|nr:DUF664 domain-containing protein [Pseudonocardiaceae bacterium]